MNRELSPLRPGIMLVMIAFVVYAGCTGDRRITPDSAPPAAVTDLRILDADSFSVELTWSAPGDDGNEGQASEYDVHYAQNYITEAAFDSVPEFQGVSAPRAVGRAETLLVTELNQGRPYYFAIKTADERSNWSGLSNVVDTLTLGEWDTIPPGKVIDLRASGITDASLILEWTAPGDNDYDAEGDPATEYDLRHSLTEGSDSTWWAEAIRITTPAPSPVNESEQVEVGGLLADTLYYFALIVRDEEANESAAAYMAVSTLADTTAPGTPSNLRFVLAAKTDTSLTLEWTAPGDNGHVGSAQLYDVRYSTTPGSGDDWFAAADTAGREPQPSEAGATEQYTLGGLEPATYYFVGVRAGDEVPNWSAVSDIIADTTAAAPDSTPPGAVAEFALQSVTDSSLTISWIAPGEMDSTIYATEYEIRYTTGVLNENTWAAATLAGSIPLPASPGEEEEFTIDELAANRSYAVALKWANQDAEWSELSTVVHALTPWNGSFSISMIKVPEGSFVMGDGASFCGNEEHAVTLTTEFDIGQYEVSNQEYLDLLQWAYNQGFVKTDSSNVWDNLDGAGEILVDLGAAGCEIAFTNGVFSIRNVGHGENPNHPVKEVSWFGAAAFCDWYNLHEGLTLAYDHTDWSLVADSPYSTTGFRLPTDAEWEYAARYNDGRIYPWGDDDPDCMLANYWECNVGWTAPVNSYVGAPTIGEKSFHNLAGNVWEWCQDWFVCETGLAPVTDPTGPTSGTKRLVRGGSWYLVEPNRMRCASRGQSQVPNFSSERIGFRVAQSGTP